MTFAEQTNTRIKLAEIYRAIAETLSSLPYLLKLQPDIEELGHIEDGHLEIESLYPGIDKKIRIKSYDTKLTIFRYRTFGPLGQVGFAFEYEDPVKLNTAIIDGVTDIFGIYDSQTGHYKTTIITDTNIYTITDRDGEYPDWIKRIDCDTDHILKEKQVFA